MTQASVFAKVVTLAILISLTGSAMAWTRTLTFEQGTIGSKAQGGGDDDFDDAAGGSYITNEEVLLGSQAAKLTITEGATAFGKWGGIVHFPELLKKGDEIWFSVNLYFPSGFNWDSYGRGSLLKFLRVHVQTSSGDNSGYNDWYMTPEDTVIPHQFLYEGQQQWFRFGAESDEIQRGRWEHYEMYIKFDNRSTDQGGTALVRVWKDGRLLDEITGAETLNSSTDTSDRAHLFTYWNGGAPKTQHMYADQIVVTSDRPSNRDAAGNLMVGPPSSSGVSRPQSPQLNVQ
ncbi:polysaccharide lyase [Marinobacter sp. F4216]|uniref:polysaccharide lyase n=1 Tax=Marinobacter sp. F4216 TaxID=2874281 RepID=UPI001CBD5E3D|nr:polysaccharide lyase [Marinobacter sp. F4216]MBZ2167855.1 polysaccharide lyase [Marinobacter sp. F4216]